MDFNTIAFLLLGFMVTGYAILDGFDLGVGVLSLFARSKVERDMLVAAIDPVWDGNQVWLLATGNVLFAAFPLVFTTVFGGLYLAFMLLLAGVVARTTAIEFRRMHSSTGWVRSWDWIFGFGCAFVAIILGAALGNVLGGLPIGPEFSWRGSALGFLNFYALLIGILTCALFTMHGAIFLWMKTERALSDHLGRIAYRAFGVFLILYAVAAVVTARAYRHFFSRKRTALFSGPSPPSWR